MRTIAEVQQQLATTADRGLAAADVAKSVQRYGANRLTPLPKEPLWKKFIDKFWFNVEAARNRWTNYGPASCIMA